MQALLDSPDPSTRDGVRDRAMLHLAVCAGLRVSELTGLRLDDVAPQSASIRVRGKGRRERALPLWKTTAAAFVLGWRFEDRSASPELFVNARGEPFSRWGVAYVLRRHTETACSKMLNVERQTSLTPRASAYLRNGGATSNARHPQSLPVAGAQQSDHDGSLRSSRSRRKSWRPSKRSCHQASAKAGFGLPTNCSRF